MNEIPRRCRPGAPFSEGAVDAIGLLQEHHLRISMSPAELVIPGVWRNGRMTMLLPTVKERKCSGDVRQNANSEQVSPK